MSRLEELTENFGVTLKHMAEQSYKPITNGDRIRAMSDEELAEAFIAAARGLLDGLGMNGSIIEDYKEAVLAVIKQPAEVDNEHR